MTKEKKSSKNDEITSLKEELTQMSNNFLRLQAEFANYRKRNDCLAEDSFNNGVERVLTKLIDVLDDFDLALQNTDAKPEDIKKGLELIYAKLFGVGEEFNLKKIDCKDQIFDPKIHEALLAEESEKPEGTILEELQKGYKVNENVIRHSKVKVSKNTEEQNKSSNTKNNKGEKNE